MDDAVAIFTVIGSIATVVTAGAAVAALTLWRKQSDHELAKKTSAALWQVQTARTRTIDLLRRFQDEEWRAAPHFGVIIRDPLAHHVKQLNEAIEGLQAFEGQVAVQWGHALFKLVKLIGHESWLFAQAVKVEMHPDMEHVELGRLAFISPSIAPTFTGGAYERAMDLYTQLAQDWLAVHVGRTGARPVAAYEFEDRCTQIDAEVARLSEPEKATAAQMKKRVISEFHAVIRAMSEDDDDREDTDSDESD